MRKAGILLIITLLFVSYSPVFSSNQLDSLMQVLETQQEDSMRVQTMMDICLWAAKYDGQLLDSMAREMLTLSAEIGFTKGLAFANDCIAIRHYQKGDLNQADSLFILASQQYWSMGNKGKSLDSYVKSGIMNLVMGDFEQALDKFSQAEDSSRKYNLQRILAKVMNEKAIIFFHRNQFDSAEHYFEQAVSYGETGKYLEEVHRALFNLSVLMSNKNEPGEANKNLIKLFESQKEAGGGNWELSKTLHGIGENYLLLGDFPGALESLLESTALLEKIGDQTLLPLLYSRLGALYQEIQDTSESINYIEKSLAVLPDSGILVEQLQALLNIANIYTIQENFDEALELYDRALVDLTKNGMFVKMIDSWVAKANIFVQKNQLDLAKLALQKADSISTAQEAPALRDLIGNAYARYYLKKGDHQQSLSYVLPVWDSVQTTTDFQDKLETVGILYQAYKGLGRYDKAFEFLELYQDYNDSTMNKTVVRKMAVAQFEREKERLIQEKKQQENLLLAEQKAKRSQRNLFIIGILALLLIAFALYRNYRIKRKANLELASQNQIIEEQKKGLQELNEMKDHIFAILGHDLRKPALAFRGLSKKLAYLIRKEDYKTLQRIGEQLERDAGDLYSLTDNILHWALLQKAGYQYRPQTFDIRESIEEVVAIFDRAAAIKGIELVKGIEGEVLVNADPHAIQTVIRNLVDNALKFTSAGGKVQLTAEQQGEKVCLMVWDTGTGISEQKRRDLFSISTKSQTGTTGEQGTGLGLHLVHSLVQKNRGQIHVNSQPALGTTFEITLPAAV